MFSHRPEDYHLVLGGHICKLYLGDLSSLIAHVAPLSFNTLKSFHPGFVKHGFLHASFIYPKVNTAT